MMKRDSILMGFASIFTYLGIVTLSSAFFGFAIGFFIGGIEGIEIAWNVLWPPFFVIGNTFVLLAPLCKSCKE